MIENRKKNSLNIIEKTVIKKYKYAQINLLTDLSNNKYIEKIQFNIPPVVPLPFDYDCNGLEILQSIIEPLKIPHPRIIDNTQNDKNTKYIMEYINGINCEEEPKEGYLYIAAEKIGEIYLKSKQNLNQLPISIVEKYDLSKSKILNYIEIINKYFELPSINSLIEYIFEKSKNQTIFVNHHDIQFKNFIYKDDLYLIDWDNVRIHPFYSDLYSLIELAHEVNADIEKIKNCYLKTSQISSITDEDIYIGGIIGSIKGVFELIIFDCPAEWIEDSYNGLIEQVKKFKF